ncbi:MAG: FecR family protein [Adhaeribacter sp.]
MERSGEHLYEELAEKWLKGSITPEEEAVFNAWYNKNQDAKIQVPGFVAGNETEHGKRLLHNIQQTIASEKNSSQGVGQAWKIAATLALLLVATGLLYFSRQRGSQEYAAAKGQRQESHQLALSRDAILTLADGSRIRLKDMASGVLLKQGQVEINKTGSGVLQYQAAAPANRQLGAGQFNTIEVPLGAQYQLVLSDGSKVWLNAGSSLRFPVSFGEEARRVELKGEGYFEVAKGKRPFLVQAGELQVKVLGTHFNIMAYENETELRTTLLEGAVQLEAGGEQQQLHPGQQVALDRQQQFRLVPGADVTEAVAWKNGLFQFKNSGLDAILRQISRRYDVQIHLDGPISGKKFTGKIPLTTNLSEVLDILKFMGFDYELEGKKVLIRPDYKVGS